jgi:hypothetical protein
MRGKKTFENDSLKFTPDLMRKEGCLAHDLARVLNRCAKQPRGPGVREGRNLDLAAAVELFARDAVI